MHQPVMLNEVIELMAIKADGTYIDGTAGSGGHTTAILQRLGENGRVLAIDRDAEALERTHARTAAWRSQCVLAQGNFGEMQAIAEHEGFEKVDGVLLDLGMSSNQVDDAGRGFSFQKDGPLDMRMDQGQALTAADIVNSADEEDLRRMIWVLGEEKAARRIARAIVRERDREPISSTMRLASIVSDAKGGRRGKTHPATRTFQAFRMAVNDEMENLNKGLEAALSLLKRSGRLAVITFHSLEDREVKQFFAAHVGKEESLQAGGSRWVGREPRAAWVAKKPVTASEEELERNPRARSAKLRVIERM